MIQPLVADLLPWVIVFYLADGIVQLGRGHMLLAGSGSLRPLRAGLRWLGPSPLAEAVAVFDLPFLRAGGRLHVLDPGRRIEPAVIGDADLVAFDPAAAGPLAREGKVVTAGGRKLLSAPTPGTAEQLLALLAPGEPGAARQQAASRAGRRHRTDLRAARALRLRQRPYRLALRVLSALLFADLLALALAIWSPLADEVPLGPAASAFGALLLAVAAVGVAFLRASGEGWRTSIGGGLAMLLPWEGLHPLIHLSRSPFRRFDALTTAAALLPPEAFHGLAARELVRARLSRARTAPELAPAWLEREEHLGHLLAATGSSVEAALAPPPASGGAAAYCPLCRTSYRSGFDECADCGIALEPLPVPSGGARTPRTAP